MKILDVIFFILGLIAISIVIIFQSVCIAILQVSEYMKEGENDGGGWMC